MNLNRKQRIYSILTVLPLVPFLLILALINHICYFLADVLNGIVMCLDRFDSFMVQNHKKFIRSVK